MKSILKLTFITSLIFCSQLVFGQTELTAEKSTVNDTKELEEVPQIFKDYAWLSEHVNLKKCNGAKLSIKTSTTNEAHKYIILTKDGKKSMYTTDGKLYCADHSSLNCEEFYKLDKELDLWSCDK